MPLVEDCMTPDVLTVAPDSTLAEAAEVMVERNVGSAIVCETDGRLAGILTERDVMRAVARGRVPWATPARDCMTANPVTIGPTTDVTDAQRRMVEGGFRHMPVLADEKVVGVISVRDIVRATVEERDERERSGGLPVS